MMVLPLIFRTRWTDRRSKTRRRLSINWSQNEKNREIIRNRLECKTRGACVSIFCEPISNSYTASVDRLVAENGIES